MRVRYEVRPDLLDVSILLLIVGRVDSGPRSDMLFWKRHFDTEHHQLPFLCHLLESDHSMDSLTDFFEGLLGE